VKALVFADGEPRVEERPDPSPSRGEAIVRVTLAGICRTDLEIARGYMGFDGIPGHEFVGVVESAPEPGFAGRRVVGEINVGCGSCERCRRGLGRHCPRRTVLGIAGRDGAFAERLALPTANLHAVPDAMPDEVAVFTEPLAAAYEILEQVRPAAGTAALVLGDGRLGQLCASVLARAGSPPSVVGRHPEKLRRLERMGLRAIPAGTAIPREFDLAVEATGTPEGLALALSAVRPRGTVVLKSTYRGAAPVALAPAVVDEITIVGSRCGPFAPALEHLSTDPAVTEGLVSGRFPMAEAAAAFARAAAPDALKVLLAP
jgi:threonine dehydrogenase-like Zn-dependent dehydrogenase